MEIAKSTPLSPTTPQSHAPGIKNNNCFRCDQQGHWARDCPNKSQPTATGAAVDGLKNPTIQCPCGRGACPIRISKSKKNPDRKFYACPVPGTSGCKFFKWFDEVTDDDIKSCPQSKFPKCACGAGICRKLKGKNGRSYFVCRIKTGHGACRFFQPENTSENTSVGEHVDGSKDYCSSQSTQDSHPSLEQYETMEIEVQEVEYPQGFPSLVSMPTSSAEDDTQLMVGRIYDQTSDISSPNHHDPSPCVAPENGSPTLQSTTGDIVMQETESLNSKTKKRSRGISLMSQNEVHCWQIEFWRQISAAKDISTAGIFPNYDPIFVPERDKLSSPTPEADRQLWNGVPWKPSGLERSATPMQSLEQAAVQFQKSLEQAALHFQNEFVIILNRIDPSDPDTMTKEAHKFFSDLDRVQLPIDYEPFSRRVREFIEAATRLAGIEKSICNDCSLEELTELYNGKKVRFDDISKAHDEAVAAFENSSQRHQSLQEEASRLRDMLLLIESQSSCCEAETSERKIRVDAISKVKLESKKRMEEAKEMLKLREQREEERCAAKAALEQARIQLQQ